MATKRLVKKWDKNLLLQVNQEEIKELLKMYSSPTFMENIMAVMMKKNKL